MPAGQPPKFKSVKELQEKIDAYFAVTPQTQVTVTGLALALNTSRETLMNYEKKEEFFDTIKTAKTRVEHSYELSLRVRGSAGDIFGLKNFGWRDKSEQELTGRDGGPIETTTLTYMPKQLKSDYFENAPDEAD